MLQLVKGFKAKYQNGSNSLLIIFLILISPLLLLYLVIYFFCDFFYGFVLTLGVWLFWCTRGRYVLFVYSESPNWKIHIEEEILPKLLNHAVILNWSNRKKIPWYSFPNLIFNYFAGDREWNPMAVIFKPFKLPREFRFWSGYKAYKHGDPTALTKEISEMFECLNTIINREEKSL